MLELKNLLDNIIAQHAKSHQFINEIGEDIIINGDEFYLISLFHNLIENAKKYSEKLTSITFTSKKINENVIISIADEGIGIKDEFKQKIYESRVSNSKAWFEYNDLIITFNKSKEKQNILDNYLKIIKD